MNVSGWTNSKSNNRKAGTLGVRVGRANAEQYFDKRWPIVYIEMDSTVVPVKITAGFWSNCPELRSAAIGDWMSGKGMVPWRKGDPPRLMLVPVVGNRFRLSC